MKTAVLPLNTGEGVRPEIGRMISNMVTQAVANSFNAEVQGISYLGQVQEDGVNKVSHAQLGPVLSSYEMFAPLFNEGFERIIHGLITNSEIGFTLQVQVHEKDNPEPIYSQAQTFALADIFSQLDQFAKLVTEQSGATFGEGAGELHVGTKNPEALIQFMVGYDGFQYIQQAQGAVVNSYDPGDYMAAFLKALELDPSYEAAFEFSVQLCRACAAYRLGNFEDSEKTLATLTALRPGDYRPAAALGEIYSTVGNFPRAVDAYEKAVALHLKLGDELEDPAIQERAALYSRLGVAQLSIGMPVNAEANLRKAINLEAPEKPSLDILANVLVQTQRGHEIPVLWKQESDRNPQDALARAKHAGSLAQLGRQEEAVAAFEAALADLEDSTIVKRFYAPLLAGTGELDRAMDFYEDYLDAVPNDIPMLVEYANTLKAADREFEIPAVLKTILGNNPDPNTRAQTLGWLIELDQPKRAEAVEEARVKMDAKDFDGAVRILKPLRNWLADYWKLWALLTAAYNQLQMFEEAEESAQKLLNLFPGYEPGYGELVTALGGRGMHQEAYNVMRHAVNNIPNSLGVHLNLALAAKRAGHEDEAKTLARQIREAVGANEELEPVLAEIES